MEIEDLKKETGQDDVRDKLKTNAREDESRDSLDKLILDTTVNKYDLIILARRWAYELKSREGEVRSLQELIPDSVRDILTAKVNPKTIRELPQLRFLAKKLKGPNAAILENIGKVPTDAEDGPRKESKFKKK